jgi:hypothetical protein
MIRGKIHYFGPWNDPEGALDKYNKERADSAPEATSSAYACLQEPYTPATYNLDQCDGAWSAGDKEGRPLCGYQALAGDDLDATLAVPAPFLWE